MAHNRFMSPPALPTPAAGYDRATTLAVRLAAMVALADDLPDRVRAEWSHLDDQARRFWLGYAAQWLASIDDAGPSPAATSQLQAAATHLDGLTGAVRAHVPNPTGLLADALDRAERAALSCHLQSTTADPAAEGVR